MRAFQSRNNPFQMAQFKEGVQSVLVIDAGVFHSPAVMECRVFRTDSRIIQPRRNGMRRHHLPILVLEDVRERSMSYAGTDACKARRVVAEYRTSSTSFNADHPHLLVRNKIVEKAY